MGFPRRPMALAVSFFLLFSSDLEANSYSFALLEEGELPKDIETVAVFQRNGVSIRNGLHETTREGDLVLSETDILRFLREGKYHSRKPDSALESKLKSLKAELEKDDETLSGEDESLTLEKREHLQEQVRKTAESIQKTWGCEGALLDKRDRLFLWRLLRPNLLEVYLNAAQLCYLEIPSDKPVELKSRESVSEGVSKPTISRESFPISKDFLPATGHEFLIGRDVILDFVRQGDWKEVEARSRVTILGMNGCVTEFRIPITEHMEQWKTTSREPWRKDLTGNRIVGFAAPGNSAFHAVFADETRTVWRAKLITDAHLELDNGKGGLFLLSIPELEKEGHGVPQPVPGRGFGG